MNRTKGLSLQIVGAVALAALFGTSAFAESSHQNRTGRGVSGARNTQHLRAPVRAPQHFAARRVIERSPRVIERSPRVIERSPRVIERSPRVIQRSPRVVVHNDFRRGAPVRSFNSGFGVRGRAMFSQGRVSRLVHENGGYRVWLDGGRFPFFVPEARFRSFPLRVGLGIRFGGFYDPLGYVAVNDIGSYNGYYPTSQGELTGVVETVDFRQGTLVLNDDASGRNVTVAMGNDSQLQDLRRGDQVELSGSWSRNGLFRADQLDGVRQGGSDNRYNGDDQDDRNN